MFYVSIKVLCFFRYGLCGQPLEYAYHVHVDCSLAQDVRRLIQKWCAVNHASYCNISALLNFVSNWESCSLKRKIVMVIFYGLLWLHWRARNNIVFNNMILYVSMLNHDIIYTVFIWMKYRDNQEFLIGLMLYLLLIVPNPLLFIRLPLGQFSTRFSFIASYQLYLSFFSETSSNAIIYKLNIDGLFSPPTLPTISHAITSAAAAYDGLILPPPTEIPVEEVFYDVVGATQNQNWCQGCLWLHFSDEHRLYSQSNQLYFLQHVCFSFSKIHFLY